MLSNRSLILILWLSCLLLTGGWLSHSLQPQSDLSLFLPGGESETQQLLLDELHHGQGNRLLLMGITGGDADGRADLSQLLVAGLRQSGLFERVENGTPVDLQIDPQLLRYRYLLLPSQTLRESLSEAGLRQALEERLQALRNPLPSPFKSLLPRDPTAAYERLLLNDKSLHPVARKAGVWASKNGDMALLLAYTRVGGMALTDQAQAVKEIKASFQQFNRSATYRLILSGPGTFGVFSKQKIETESRQLSIFASLAIALLLFFAYRHLPYLLYAALPLISGMLVAILTTQVLFQQIHGITLAFGITLLGVTLDYPVHLFSHLTHGESARHTIKRIWPTLRLGVLTTCLGYLTLVSTDFTGLRQLGVFTLAGLSTAALLSRYLLPRLVRDNSHERPWGMRLLQPLNRERWLPAILMSLLCILSVVTLSSGQRLWNDDVAVLSPLPPELLQQDRFLRQQLMADESNQLLMLRGETLQQLLELCEALSPVLKHAVEQGFSADASLPCSLLPSQSMQIGRQGLIPNHAEMSARLDRALEGLPFRPGAFDPFLEELQQSRELPTLSYAELADGPLRARLDAQLKHEQPHWLALLPLRQVTNEKALAGLIRDELPEVTYLNLRHETSRLIGGFRQEILQKISLGALVMLAVLWISLRSITRALGTLLPIAVALLCTTAILVMLGESMNIFHLVSLMLVLGIGIDYSLFFSRRTSQKTEQYQTLHALTLCALSTVSVFAILGNSDIPVLHAIGQTVAYGVGLSYLATYAFWHIPANPLRGGAS